MTKCLERCRDFFGGGGLRQFSQAVQPGRIERAHAFSAGPYVDVLFDPVGRRLPRCGARSRREPLHRPRRPSTRSRLGVRGIWIAVRGHGCGGGAARPQEILRPPATLDCRPGNARLAAGQREPHSRLEEAAFRTVTLRGKAPLANVRTMAAVHAAMFDAVPALQVQRHDPCRRFTRCGGRRRCPCAAPAGAATRTEERHVGA
jgi:hypothetical protein